MAIAFVNGATGSGKAVANVSAGALSVTKGNLLIVAVSVNYNLTAAGVTDTVGNYYQAINAVNTAGASVRVFGAVNKADNASNVVTVNSLGTSSGNAAVVTVEQYSGAQNIGAIPAANSGTSASATTTALTTTQPNSWVIGAVAAANKTTISAGASTNIRENLTTGGGAGATNVGGAEGDSGDVAAKGTSTTLAFSLSASVAWAAVSFELIGVAVLGIEFFAQSQYVDTGSGGGTSITITHLSTLAAKSVIVIYIHFVSFLPSISDTAGLTWIFRASISLDNIYEYYAIVPSQLFDDTITVSSSAQQMRAMQAVVGNAVGFDNNSSLPATVSVDNTTSLSVNISTNSPALVLSLIEFFSNDSPSLTVGSGYTAALNTIEVGLTNDAGIEYAVFASPQTNLAVTWSASTSGTLEEWRGFNDALVSSFPAAGGTLPLMGAG